MKLNKIHKEYAVIPESKLATTLIFKRRMDAILYKRSLKLSVSDIRSRIEIISRYDDGLMLENKEIK